MASPHPVPAAARRFLVVLGVVALLAACSGGGDDASTDLVDGPADTAVPTEDASADSSSTTDTASDEASSEGSASVSSASDDSAPEGATSGDAATDDDGAEAPTGASFDGLVWTVVAVDWDDELNVRADPDPDAEIVATLDPWSQAFVGRADVVEVDGARWRAIETDDGTEGWVNARYIVAQPSELSAADEAILADATSALVYWALGVDDHGAAPRLADRALWVGGIGVYADFPIWNWIPAAQADEADEWTSTRTFDLDEPDLTCGRECERSIVEFLHFDRLGDDWTVAVESDLDPGRNGFTDGPFANAPAGFHRAVIDKPASEGTDADGNPMIELDWQRIHVVHDWSTATDGDPRLFLINTWGWTP